MTYFADFIQFFVRFSLFLENIICLILLKNLKNDLPKVYYLYKLFFIGILLFIIKYMFISISTGFTLSTFLLNIDYIITVAYFGFFRERGGESCLPISRKGLKRLFFLYI